MVDNVYLLRIADLNGAIHLEINYIVFLYEQQKESDARTDPLRILFVMHVNGVLLSLAKT